MSEINMDLKKMSKIFVANMNIVRRENDLSYRGMAKALGVSDSTVRRIETARKTRFGKGEQGYIPSLGTVVKLAQATHITPGQLLTERL